MPVELKVPEVGESITEVQIGRWLKTEGDAIDKDDPLVEIETDKITLELPAPAQGRMGKVLKQQGDEAQVGDVIGYMDEGAEGAPSGGESAGASAKQHKAEPKAASTPAKAQATAEDVGTAAPTGGQRNATQTAPAVGPNGAAEEVLIMPSAQRLLEQNGLSAGQVPATGPGGRLLKEDVERFLEQKSAATSSTSAPAESPAVSPSAGAREEESVPMSPMRRRIAQRLIEAQQTAALLTTFNEVDMTEVMALRNRYKDAFAQKHDVKLGFMSFFVKASIEALKAFPGVNAEIRGTNIIYKNYYDVGIAIGSGKGLVVPILRDADHLSFAGVEKAIGDFAQKVKENKLALEDLQGGTFTITNGGIFGSMMSTPIINPPQSGVLGMHAITPRPMAVNGEVKIRPMMYLALTYDHRLVDGREAVSFLKLIKDLIEDPSRLMLEV